MLSSRLRLVSSRVALRSAAAALRPVIAKTTPLALSTCQQRRHYAKDRQVSYTVDKFPGYVRNENYKKVKTPQSDAIYLVIHSIHSLHNKTLIISRPLLVNKV
jgi:D-lactate dehydrogenase (cytochrome)